MDFLKIFFIFPSKQANLVGGETVFLLLHTSYNRIETQSLVTRCYCYEGGWYELHGMCDLPYVWEF